MTLDVITQFVLTFGLWFSLWAIAKYRIMFPIISLVACGFALIVYYPNGQFSNMTYSVIAILLLIKLSFEKNSNWRWFNVKK